MVAAGFCGKNPGEKNHTKGLRGPGKVQRNLKKKIKRKGGDL